MIRHVVIFTCKPSTQKEDLLAAVESAKQSLSPIPGVNSFTAGTDKGLQPGRSGDFSVVADFDSTDAVLHYLNHPTHVDFVRDVLAPIVESRISVQFEI